MYNYIYIDYVCIYIYIIYIYRGVIYYTTKYKEINIVVMGVWVVRGGARGMDIEGATEAADTRAWLIGILELTLYQP